MKLDTNYAEKNTRNSQYDTHLENLALLGYTVLIEIIPNEECKIIASKLDDLNKKQIQEYGEEQLNLENIDSILFCLNPSYIKFIIKRLGTKKFHYLLPFKQL